MTTSRRGTREPFIQSPLGARALEYIDQAREQVADGLDAIPALSGAIACLRAEARAEAGELPADEVDEVLHGQVD